MTDTGPDYDYIKIQQLALICAGIALSIFVIFCCCKYLSTENEDAEGIPIVLRFNDEDYDLTMTDFEAGSYRTDISTAEGYSITYSAGGCTLYDADDNLLGVDTDASILVTNKTGLEDYIRLEK